MFVRTSWTRRPRLNKYVFVENDLVFNANATIVLHLHVLFLSFPYHFQPSTRKRSKRLKTVKTGVNLLFAFQDNLNNLWVIVASFSKVCVFSENDPSTPPRYQYSNIFHFGDRFQKLPFSVKMIIILIVSV